MGNKSGHTRQTTNWLGHEKEEHFDVDGNKIGETKFEGQKQVHFDTEGHKIGETKREEGLFRGKATHYDSEGHQIGYSKNDADFFGSLQRHYDSSKEEVGCSREDDYWDWETMSLKSQKVHHGEHLKVKPRQTPSRDPGFYHDDIRGYKTEGWGEGSANDILGEIIAFGLLAMIAALILYALGETIEKRIIKNIWPAYETTAERDVRLRSENNREWEKIFVSLYKWLDQWLKKNLPNLKKTDNSSRPYFRYDKKDRDIWAIGGIAFENGPVKKFILYSPDNGSTWRIRTEMPPPK